MRYKLAEGSSIKATTVPEAKKIMMAATKSKTAAP
jgi:hypothetical protein